MSLSPDGKWFWNGTEWIPAPPTVAPAPVTPAPITHSSQYGNGGFEPLFEPSTPKYQFNGGMDTIYYDQPSSSGKKVALIIGIVAMVVIAGIGLIILLIPDPVEPDEVTLSYIYAHTCDRVLATYSDEYGDVEQDYDYYEGDIIIQFDGEMYEGDEMIGSIIVSNFDDESCAITVLYAVIINGGDVIELAKTGPIWADQYDDATLTYVYTHGEI